MVLPKHFSRFSSPPGLSSLPTGEEVFVAYRLCILLLNNPAPANKPDPNRIIVVGSGVGVIEMSTNSDCKVVEVRYTPITRPRGERPPWVPRLLWMMEGRLVHVMSR